MPVKDLKAWFDDLDQNLADHDKTGWQNES